MQLRLFKEGDTEDWVIIEMQVRKVPHAGNERPFQALQLQYLPPFPCVTCQGDLESRVGETDMASKFIGDLHYSKDNGAPILIIGHHILHGKVVEMARPFVAMEKRRTGRSRQDGRNEASCPSQFTDPTKIASVHFVLTAEQVLK